jgi:quercetin dioxygenase-like cupin family protein
MEHIRLQDDQRATLNGLPAAVGTLTLPAGTRVPAEGTSVHAQDELSFILAGEMRAWSGGQAFELRAGDVTLIPAGEEHWAEVVRDVTLSYVLLERRP